MNYGHKKVVSDNMELAEKNLREVLMQNGFGVITEINIKEKLEEKLGVDFIQYKIRDPAIHLQHLNLWK